MTLNFLPSIGAPRQATAGCGTRSATTATASRRRPRSERSWPTASPGATTNGRASSQPAPTLPPEPFLWLTARGLLALFGTIDRITDGQIRAARR